jgi:predicted  nucleic acid-binding Zn-ribbon protein
LKKAEAQNIETLSKMEHQQKVIDNATNKLNEATDEIKKAKNEIEDIQKKSFSRSGTLSLSKPLEDDIQNLHNRLQKVEEKLGLAFFSQRKYGRHRSF